MQHSLEYLTIAVYLVVLLVLGVVLSRVNRNVSDYIRGGGQGTWWLVGTSGFMCSFSAYTFTANGGLAFVGGPTPLIIFVAIAAGQVVCAWLTGPWIRQTRAITLPDIIRERFGPEVEQFYVYLGALNYPIMASVQLWALCFFCSAVFGFPLIPTILTFGLVTVLYSATGGRWAVLATDFVQGLILIPLTLLVGFLCFKKIGGVGAFFEYFSKPEFAADFTLLKPAGQFPDNSFTLGWVVAMFLVLFFYETSLLYAHKYLSVKDGREARKAASLSSILMFCGGFIFLMPPMVARFLFSDKVEAVPVANSAEAAYSVAAMQVLPNGLLGILVVAMFAATMSSMSPALNESAGQIVHNMLPALWRRLKWKPLREETSLRLCRIATFVLGGCIVTYAILWASVSELRIFDAFVIINSLITLPVSLPFFIGLFVKKLPRWSYFFMVGCALVPSLVAFIDKTVNDNAWNFQQRMLSIIACAFVGAIISRLLYRTSAQDYRDRVDALFKRMRTPIDFQAEVKTDRDQFQLRLMGTTALIAAALLCLLLLVPNTAGGRISVLFLSGFVAVIGGLLRWAGSRARAPVDSAADPPGPGTP